VHCRFGRPRSSGRWPSPYRQQADRLYYTETALNPKAQAPPKSACTAQLDRIILDHPPKCPVWAKPSSAPLRGATCPPLKTAPRSPIGAALVTPRMPPLRGDDCLPPEALPPCARPWPRLQACLACAFVLFPAGLPAPAHCAAKRNPKGRALDFHTHLKDWLGLTWWAA
jgi:hypothetical protein